MVDKVRDEDIELVLGNCDSNDIRKNPDNIKALLQRLKTRTESNGEELRVRTNELNKEVIVSVRNGSRYRLVTVFKLNEDASFLSDFES